MIFVYNEIMNLDDKSLKLTKKRIEDCHTLGLYTVQDVLEYYPMRYEVLNVQPFHEWKLKDKVSFEGVVASPARTFYKGRMSSSSFEVMYDEHLLRLTVFNRPWAKSLSVETHITVQGVYQGNNRVTVISYDLKPVKEHDTVTPVYSLKEGIRQKTVRAVIQKVFETCENEIRDDVPETMIHRYRLLRRRDALYRIHFPSSMNDVKSAVRTLKYEEFLRFFTAVFYMNEASSSLSKPVRIFDRSEVYRVADSLPFSLTSGQKKALDDILNDMSEARPMYRLVQGDVGCGKTVVALLAMYACVLSGYQAAFLAPTEILARQHIHSVNEILKGRVRAEVLYSGMSKKEKEDVIARTAKGEIQILVGTHALIQDTVSFARLGLVIADEQQRFGVEQRRALVHKGDACDFLLMSATPIPRTLASCLFGEVNVSVIDTLPCGRKEPVTKLIRENSFRSVLYDVTALLESGRQLYIICAAVEENAANVRNVEQVAENVQKLFKDYRVSVLSGPMKSEKKDEVMHEFLENRSQILVATTVVEVGVNVVNATGMLIYNAERFGLSQLHQLRGRIQRGSHQGQCWLLTDAKDSGTLERLETLVKTNDGFVIAQEDLRLRGPGDILGNRQSGLPDLLLGNINDDSRIVETAQKDAREILASRENPDYAGILDEIADRYQKDYVD